MSQDHTQRRLSNEPEPTEDVEILEVVGVDENGNPIEGADPNDVEVIFEDEPVALEPAPEAPREDRELKERLVRLQADFENFKKRIDRERYDHFRYATFGLIGRILPVLDNFERAMAAVRQGGTSDALIEGVALIQRQLAAELEAEGLRAMESVGETFDPERHEAVATDPNSPVAPHTVTQVFQRGYFLHDRVLRPAMVRVRVEAGDGVAAPDERKES